MVIALFVLIGVESNAIPPSLCQVTEQFPDGQLKLLLIVTLAFSLGSFIMARPTQGVLQFIAEESTSCLFFAINLLPI